MSTLLAKIVESFFAPSYLLLRLSCRYAETHLRDGLRYTCRRFFACSSRHSHRPISDAVRAASAGYAALIRTYARESSWLTA